MFFLLLNQALKSSHPFPYKAAAFNVEEIQFSVDIFNQDDDLQSKADLNTDNPLLNNQVRPFMNSTLRITHSFSRDSIVVGVGLHAQIVRYQVVANR